MAQQQLGLHWATVALGCVLGIVVSMAIPHIFATAKDESPIILRTCCSADFLSKAERLFQPKFGTEVMGPLLYQLVRFQRPRRVVEFGCGYSSAFLAQALADNAAAIVHELQDDQRGALRRTGFYQDRSHDVRRHPLELHIVDRDPVGLARVRAVLQDLGLLDSSLLQISIAEATTGSDAKEPHASLRFANASVDFMWSDSHLWDPASLLSDWYRLTPGRGIMCLHNSVGTHDVLGEPEWAWGDIEQWLEHLLPDSEGFETLTLLEPHKVYQGSFTAVRRLDLSAHASRRLVNELVPKEVDGEQVASWEAGPWQDMAELTGKAEQRGKGFRRKDRSVTETATFYRTMRVPS